MFWKYLRFILSINLEKLYNLFSEIFSILTFTDFGADYLHLHLTILNIVNLQKNKIHYSFCFGIAFFVIFSLKDYLFCKRWLCEVLFSPEKNMMSRSYKLSYLCVFIFTDILYYYRPGSQLYMSNFMQTIQTQIFPIFFF